MNKMQTQVEEFHKEMGLDFSEKPVTLSPEAKARRINLITEELTELVKALYQDDYSEQIDALCDLVYVVLGTAVEMGIDLEPFFDEVHRSNMTKIGGHKRESDGKWIKPDNYSPALISLIFSELYGGTSL